MIRLSLNYVHSRRVMTLIFVGKGGHKTCGKTGVRVESLNPMSGCLKGYKESLPLYFRNLLRLS